ncbi:hypothetical protein [Pseudomonas citronellolis]|uniref:hypothetical protein n=1 Tax=Pseudomonas citronellolis TaxID=53408 RepID=UPI0021C0C0D5|nr:hypothetical protein [Pseudomonas citronellolis]UXJ54874.1 hypothetical protein N5P21_11960 [Pseudomonas citronellolis]
MYGAYRNKKANGGLITGPGTGTSDSIQTEVPEGSYILPADTTAAIAPADSGGFGVRGYKEWKAKQDAEANQIPNYGNFGARRNKVPVNVSNGEFELPPEQVQQLGVQVLDAVKAVTHTPAPEPSADNSDTFFANGGQVVGGVEGYRKGKAIHEAHSQVPNYGNFGAYRKNYANGGLVDDPNKPRQPTAGTGDLANAFRNLPSSSMPEYRFGIRRQPPAGDAGAGSAGQVPAPASAASPAPGAPAAPGASLPSSTAPLTPGGIQSLAKQSFQDAGGLPQVPASKPAPLRPNDNGWTQLGVGAGNQGLNLNGQVVGQMGPGGVASFSNDPSTVAGAGLPREGGFGARRPAAAPAAQPGYGAYRRTPEQLAAMRQDNQDLAATGSAANLGNGVGTFSQAQAGDAQLALDRFERANQQRQQMVDTAHRGELGNNGGQLTVVSDSSRTPTLQERQLARLEALQARTDATRTGSAADAAVAGQRVASEAQRMDTEALNQQRLQQEVQQGEYGLQDQQRIDGLKAAMVDPSLSQAQREQARDTYINLITQPKDRYRSQDVILGRDENGRDIRGTQLIDVTTGQPVAGGTTQGAPLRRSVSRAEVESAAKEDGVSVDDYIRALRTKGVSVS